MVETLRKNAPMGNTTFGTVPGIFGVSRTTLANTRLHLCLQKPLVSRSQESCWISELFIEFLELETERFITRYPDNGTAKR